MTFNFDYTLSQFNDYFAAHKKVNGSRSGGFLPDVFQIWDEVIWLTLKKRRLESNAPICREQTEPSPEVRLIVECSIGVSPGQEGIVLRIKRQTQDFCSQQK